MVTFRLGAQGDLRGQPYKLHQFYHPKSQIPKSQQKPEKETKKAGLTSDS